MDLAYGIISALMIYGVTYGLLAYFAISWTKEKLEVTGNLLGTGIATMIQGFFWNEVLVLKCVDACNPWFGGAALAYAALSILNLLIGLAGIIMIVVALLEK
jgi:hypothetical protein